MSSAAIPTPMTAEAFLIWRLDREETWELVDGAPVLKFDNGPGMMAGARRNHETVGGNVFAALRWRLRGGPCRPFTAGLGVQVSPTQVRQPDVTVDCARGRGDDLTATDPTVLFEVLSPSTRSFDVSRKTGEYQRLATVRQFVLLEPDHARALVWSRDADGLWSPVQVEGLDAALDLSAIGVTLPMSDVYEDVELSGEG